MSRIPQPHPNDFNKGKEVRRDTDAVYNFVMELYDIDVTIADYISNVMKPTVTENGSKFNVPVVYGNSERWVSAREQGYLRDQNGQIVLPLIMINRNQFRRSDSIQTLNRFLSVSHVKKYSKKNKYDRFAVMTGAKPTNETYSTVYPDHITLNYQCMVWASFTEHLNEIVEKFSFADDTYWGDENSYKFRVRIDGGFDIQNEVSTNEERLVRADFNLTVEAYILPPDFANKLTTIKSYTPKRVLLMQEIEVGDVNPDLNRYGTKTPMFGRTHLPQVSMIAEYQPLFDFLTLNEQFTGTFQSTVSGGDAVFHVNNTILVSTPNELATSITESDKYQVFINGVVTPTSTYTLTNSNKEGGVNYVTITLDNGALGFDLSSTDDVIIKGKIVAN